MFKSFTRALAGLSVLTLCALAGAAAQAEDTVSEVRPVDARITRINIDGPVSVRVRQGATPALTVITERRYLSEVTTDQSGDSLRIDADLHNIHGHFGKNQAVRIELTLPNLKEVISSGVGPSDIAGFSGDDMLLSLDGVGAIVFNGQYRRLTARLGGVGDMTINAGHSEQIVVNHPGLGRIALSGNCQTLRANLSGVGNLDAQQLISDAVNVNMSGLGNATVYAKKSARLTLNGLGSVITFGQPVERTVSVNGLGKVSWK